MDLSEGIFYEDIEIGDEQTSPGRTVTEADIVNFAGLSGDFHVLHMDAEFAKITPFGKRIAHGILGLSIASGLVGRIPDTEKHKFVAFLGMTWNFRKPVFIGDTIHVVRKVASKRPTKKPGLGVVTYDAQAINQHGDVCQEGEWNTMYLIRDPQATPPTE